jgi:hypothetical protein
MSRLTTAGLLELEAGLSEREQELIQVLARLRLMTHAQLAAVLDAEDSVSGARTTRRVLSRLTELAVLARLQRRIGGIRAGSAGFIYYLGPAGQRLMAYWQGRGFTKGRVRPEPGGRYVRHRLAVSELYVQAVQAERDGLLELLSFEAEPDCWRRFGDGFGGTRTLKPDAFVRVAVGAYEDRYFVEVDLASESRSVIAAKVRAYVDYFNSGTEQEAQGVFPRILLLTTTEARKVALVETCSRLPPEQWSLFMITTSDQAVPVFCGQYGPDQAAEEQEALS